MTIKFRDEDFKTPTASGGHWQTHGNCVAVAITRHGVFVRNSDDPHKVTVSFTHEEWSTFIRGVKADEFDLSQIVRDRGSNFSNQQHRFVGPTRCLCGATVPEADDICPVSGVLLT